MSYKKVDNKFCLKNEKAQVSFEYLIIIGFVTFALIVIMGVAMFYGGTIRDSIRFTQMSNCVNKIISSAEAVFYAGEPSRSTITCYLPESVKSIAVDPSEGVNGAIIIVLGSSSGDTKKAFYSNVPITGTLSSSPGLKKIKIEATETSAELSPA